MEWQSLVIKVAIGVITALATWLGSWLLVKVKTLISTKIKNTKLAALLSAATDVVASSVKSTYQTFVENIKGTDEWNAEAQKTAFNNALTLAKEQLTSDVAAAIEELYGDVEKWLETQIESTLYDLKNE